MVAAPLDPSRYDDPRKLRAMLDRAASLACDHSLKCVVVGLAAAEGDLIFPELVSFIESALRVDDAIFRMTRERAVLVLADADRARAQEIVERLVGDFRERFPSAQEPSLSLGYYEVTHTTRSVTAKEILPAVFRSASSVH